MHILVTGAAGFLGNKLAKQLLNNGTMAGRSGQSEAITQITLCDVTAPPGCTDPRIKTVVGDIADPPTIDAALTPDVQGIFNLAAIVSGHAAAAFHLGMTLNSIGR